jgi:hypothetical protein
MAAAMTVRRPHRRHSPLWVFVPIATAFLIIAGIAIYGVISPYNAKKPPPPGARGSLVWGDGIFANKAQLKAWLTQHGASYESWAKTHPRGRLLVTPRPRHHAVLTKAKTKPKVTPAKSAARSSAPSLPASTAASAPVAVTTASDQQPVGIGIWIVVVLGLVLGTIAATPQRVLTQIGVRAGPHEREVRLAAVAAGAAVLLGVIIATIAG